MSLLLLPLCLPGAPEGPALLNPGPGTQVLPVSAEHQPAPPARPIPTGSAVFEHGDGLVAIGEAWKAYFDAEAVRIVPRLGRQAPSGSVLELRLESVRRGAFELELDTFARPAASGPDAARRVAYTRSAGVSERFEVRGAGMELAFDFESEVGEQGDLVVRYDVGGGLAPRELGGDLSELRLENEWGGLSIGGVTGIDADGEAFPGRLSFDGEHLELILLAEHVDAASWPLTLDPMIGPESALGPEGSGTYAPALSFDDTTGRYLVAWIAEYSLFDWDVVARQVLPDGTPVTSLIPLEVGQEVFSQRPSISNVRGVGKWAVAWTEFASLFGSAQAQLRSVRASDSLLSPKLAVSLGDSSEVDLGGSGAPGDLDAVVVWREFGQGVRARVVNLLGPIPVLGPEVQVSTDSSAQRPSISRTPGPFGRYLIAWDEPGSDASVLRAVRYRSLDADLGQASAESPQIVGQPGPIASGPYSADASVDGDGRNWYVTFINRQMAGAVGRVVVHRTLEKPGLAPAVVAQTSFLTSNLQEYTAVAFTGTSTCLLALNSLAGVPSTRIFHIGATFSGTYWPKNFQEPPARLDDQLDIVSTFSANHLASAQVRGAWAGADGQVWFGEVDVGQGVTEVDPGCGAPSSNRAGLISGGTSPSNTSVLSVEYDGALPGLLALSSLGFSRADFPCGTCLLVPDSFGPGNVQFRTTDSFGDAEFSLTLPYNPALSGFTAWHQWFIVDPQPECAAFGVNTSPALELVVQ